MGSKFWRLCSYLIPALEETGNILPQRRGTNKTRYDEEELHRQCRVFQIMCYRELVSPSFFEKGNGVQRSTCEYKILPMLWQTVWQYHSTCLLPEVSYEGVFKECLLKCLFKFKEFAMRRWDRKPPRTKISWNIFIKCLRHKLIDIEKFCMYCCGMWS